MVLKEHSTKKIQEIHNSSLTKNWKETGLFLSSLNKDGIMLTEKLNRVAEINAKILNKILAK